MNCLEIDRVPAHMHSSALEANIILSIRGAVQSQHLPRPSHLPGQRRQRRSQSPARVLLGLASALRACGGAAASPTRPWMGRLGTFPVVWGGGPRGSTDVQDTPVPLVGLWD